MSNNQPSQVVVAFDFSPSATAALQRALALAVRAPFHHLHIVTVIERGGDIAMVPRDTPFDYAYAERVQQAVADIVGRELQVTDVDSRVHFNIHARLGKAADEILAVASELGADIILVGSHGRVGVVRLLVGSVAERVVREAGCTVEVVRPKSYPTVELAEVIEVEPTHSYVAPHRYYYEDRRVVMRPAEWPLY
jgi:nucleotide-binding universal stress UspA family protein